MTDIELEYADYCVRKLHKCYPTSLSLEWIDSKTNKHDERLSSKEQTKIRDILIGENFIEKFSSSSRFVLTKYALPILDKYNSYYNYYIHKEKQNKKNEQKEVFEFNLSKWKYKTFWWFFAIAIFSGGYSMFDFIERLSKAKSYQLIQTPREEMESEESKSHISTLNQKSLDSLHNSKIHVDSLNMK